MEEITITQNGFDGLYMSYLYAKVKQRFSFLPAQCDLERHGQSAELAFKTEREYCPYVRKFIQEHIADIIAVGYKYEYFKSHLPLPLLSVSQKHILLTALVAADYREDKGYVLRRLRALGSYCLDGFYHFRLQELKKRWQGIVEYVPMAMNEASLAHFLQYLIDDGEGKLYIKNGKVYDQEYKPLNRSLLTGIECPIAEVLLCGVEQVYCFGDVDDKTKQFLKKYYREKAVFC